MKKSLIILAAGKGQRFGGPKQLALVFESYTILDFTIYAAIKAGFNHFIFVINETIETAFKQHWYSGKLPLSCAIDFVLQDNQPQILKPHIVANTAVKGTAYAILCACHLTEKKFGVLNADDLYGLQALQLLHDGLFGNDAGIAVLYALEKTMSKQGSVNRAKCTVVNGELKNVTEQSYHFESGVIKDSTAMAVPDNSPVSMNLWGFPDESIPLLLNRFDMFLKNPVNEFLLPDFVSYCQNKFMFKALLTDETCLGLTYATDLISLQQQIIDLVKQEKYPQKLWL